MLGNQWSNLGDQKAQTKKVDHCVVFLVILVGVCVYFSLGFSAKSGPICSIHFSDFWGIPVICVVVHGMQSLFTHHVGTMVAKSCTS